MRSELNPEPQALVDEFQSKAQDLVEQIYGLPWTQLAKMEVNELPEPILDRSSEENMEDLRELIKELSSYEDPTRVAVSIHEAIIAGKKPVFPVAMNPLDRQKVNSCEGICHSKADMEWAELYRYYFTDISECSAYGLIGTIFGGPPAGGATFIACSSFAILRFTLEGQKIQERLDMCLMECMPKDPTG